VAQAVATGDLDAETALLYTTYAAFSDPRLPEAYTGEGAGVADLDFLSDAQLAFDSLSLTSQETLAPFLVPPMVQGSWWSLQHEPLQAGAVAAASAPCDPLRADCPIDPRWVYLAGTHVKVWYLEKNEATDLPRATALLQELEAKIWPTLTAYMGVEPLEDSGSAYDGADSKLDVILVDLEAGLLGSTRPSFFWRTCGKSSVYILANRTADLVPTVAHELMHAIQFALDVKGCLLTDYKTFMESTADWAENYLYPSSQWEHQHVTAYLDHVERSLLDTTPRLRPYGAFLFPLYLTQTASPDMVKRLWGLAGQYLEGDAIAQAVKLDKVWPQFAVHLWNQPPFDQFKRWDNIAAWATVNTRDLDLKGQPDDTEVFGEDALPGLSAEIYQFVIKDSSIRTLAIFNGFTYALSYDTVDGFGREVVASPLADDARKGGHLHALLKINGTWETTPRDWTDRPYVVISLDDPDKRVDDILVVLTNADPDPQRSLQYTGLPPHVFMTNLSVLAPWEGGVDFQIADGGITQTFQATGIRFEPQVGTPGSAVTEFAYDSNLKLWATHYTLAAGGQIKYHVSGSQGDCTYSGGGTKQLASGSMLNQLTLFPFLWEGPAYRGFVLTGFDNLPPVQWPVSVQCTDSSYTEPRMHGDFYSPATGTPAAGRTVSPDGTVVSGGGPEWGANPKLTGSWSFQAVAP